MKLKMKVKKNPSSPLEKKLKELRKLNNQKVEAGHFASQGMHYSGMSYVALMKLHHTGYESTPARQIIDVFGFKVGSHQNTIFKIPLTKWANEKTPSNGSLLDRIGWLLAEKEKDVFGMPSYLVPSNAPLTVQLKGANTPMVDTEDLVNAVSYKTSTNKVVKQSG